MDLFANISGLLAVDYKNSNSLITVIQDPCTGKLISFLVDDGEEISEYSYNQAGYYAQEGSEPLQWGLFA